MTIILVLIPLSIALLTLAAAAFFWAVDNDQYDDMDTPALMPLTGDPDVPAGTPSRQGEHR